MLAGSGPEAIDALNLAAATENPVKLIILDAQMPEMDGYRLTELVRLNPQFKAVQIVLLTSCIQPGEAMRCRDIGVAACCAKPVVESELLDALRKVSPANPGIAAPQDPAQNGAAEPVNRRHVLVVEDNAVNRIVATRLLAKRNHTVTTAVDGREALDILSREQFDCVLMDVQMPVLDGLETTAAIRQIERQSGRHLPIIAMTAHAMAGDLERCLRAGMDAYLTKPIKADDVFATIERVIETLKRNPEETLKS